jgi:hypothetical protein
VRPLRCADHQLVERGRAGLPRESAFRWVALEGEPHSEGVEAVEQGDEADEA